MANAPVRGGSGDRGTPVPAGTDAAEGRTLRGTDQGVLRTVTPQERSRTRDAADSLRTALWPVPTAGIVVAVALGIGLPSLDAALGDLSAGLRDVLFSGGPSAARSVLSSLSGSLITVTSLTFSLTVVTLQLASSQFSPRLLRTFSRDPYVHWTLALFLATFTYSLVVLRTVRDSTSSDPGFVPQLSITFAVVMTIVSVFALVLFLAHLAREIRVETMLENVHDDALNTVRDVLPERPDDPSALPAEPAPPSRTRPVSAGASGFLVSVDEPDLLDAACAAGVVLVVEATPGASVVGGTPVGRSWPLDGGPRESQDRQRFDDRVTAAIHVGPERTAAQDIAFGLRQLVDVATKALSPGINDPTTGVHALGHISGLLCAMLDHQLGPKLLVDGHGRVRVVLRRPDLADLLDMAVAQPRRYGEDAPNVLARIAQLLREVGWRARDDGQRQAVRDQLRRLRDTVDQQDLGETETGELHRLCDQVDEALAGRW